MNLPFVLRGIDSGREYDPREIRYRGEDGELLEVVHSKTGRPVSRKTLQERRMSHDPIDVSGVWRYRELVLPLPYRHIIVKPEGNTNLYPAGSLENSGYNRIGRYAGVENLYLKHEGENPTGSFKDRGMTAGISMAHYLGATAVACASTGNTSASLASYAAQAGMKCFVFIPAGKISYSKLAQAIAYGAVTIQIDGDFDAAMQLVEEVCISLKVYLLNSVNPFRIEGQKTIGIELIHQLNWDVPDWIVLPGGNLGNTAALGKGLSELFQRGYISRLPRVATIQAHGASPFYRSFKSGFSEFTPMQANTIASAIRIGNPVSYKKAKQTIEFTNGLVETVTDAEIMDAKAVIDRAGIGCEPASATTLAGIRKLQNAGTIRKSDRVAAILTGHVLKDPAAIADFHEGKLPGTDPVLRNTVQHAQPTLASVREIITRVLNDTV
ncbi:MAG: threonine synthase [Patescibacteria group bacterium]|nr:threonine synthase [Patescibacteria group bacterium]